MAYQTPLALPDDVAQIAATNQLGSFSRSYRQTQSVSEVVLDGSVILIFILALFSMFLYFILNLRGSLIFSFMVASITATIFTIIRAVKASKNVVYLFQNGIIYSQNERHTPLPWPQIASYKMRRGVLYTPLDRCIVKTKKGRTIFLGNLAEYEELATSIKNSIEPH